MSQALPKVAVLMGGPDEEHDVSLVSGKAVSMALADKGYPVEEVTIDRANLWHFPGDDIPKSVGRALDRIRRDHDVVFIALHGRTGEGGRIQGALELAEIPFTGSDQQASAISMDKIISRHLYSQHGLPVAPGCGISPDDKGDPIEEARRILKDYGPTIFVKPVDSGSSYGIELMHSESDLAQRIQAAREAGYPLLAEGKIRGEELTVAVLEDADGVRALPPVLIKPLNNAAFFTLEVKYDPEAVDEICPAPISDEMTASLIELGVKAHKALGCRDFSRTDIMWSEDGPVLLETNTIPGLTPASLFPKSAAAAGIDFADLVAGLVENAMRRGA